MSKTEPYLLLVDTTEQACALALYHHGHILAEVVHEESRKHGDLFLPSVQNLLQESGLSPQQIAAIAIANGPGAFTGIRIGVSMVQGLAYGWNIPCIPVMTLDLWAASAFLHHSWDCVITAMDARMGEIYTGVYTRTQGYSELNVIELPRCLAPKDLASTWQLADVLDKNHIGLVGSGIAVYESEFKDLLASHQSVQFQPGMKLSFKAFGALALDRFQKDSTVTALELDAYYLRPAVVGSSA